MIRYAVNITDSTANTHTYGYYGANDYSWATESLNEGAAGIVFFDTFEEAAKVVDEYIEYIKDNNLDWAWAVVEEFNFDVED